MAIPRPSRYAPRVREARDGTAVATTKQRDETGKDDAAAPVTALRGVGPKLAEKLAKLGVSTVRDALFHLPLRYEDRTRVVAIGELRPGQRVQVEGVIEHTEIVRRRRASLVTRISDGSGFLTLRFFHFRAAWKDNLPRGARIRCFGEVRPGASGLEIIHPEYRRVGGEVETPVPDRLTPVYPAASGITQKQLRHIAAQALDRLQGGALLGELLPAALRREAGNVSLADALSFVHQPPADADVAALVEGRHPAQRRLAFEELVAHQLSLVRLRSRRRQAGAPALTGGADLVRRFLDSLGFELTGAQRRVTEEITADLAQSSPMLRLLQGDVGSGKTVVAAAAMLAAAGSGRQAAMVAPTELLAEQHHGTLSEWLEPLGIRIAWLTGRVKGAKRRQALEEIAGDAGVVVGTHALMEEAVRFRDLALVIVDEQHRFGVHQRLRLRDKGREGLVSPHQLVMTATPIPRTLAMTAYADLDVSALDELPPGRTPVKTIAVSHRRRDEVVERVSAACRQGRQAYWVCPLIEESDVVEAEAAEKTAGDLAERLPDVRIALVHGRMKAADKDAVMRRFNQHRIDLLVATTVIEVGVDVPNASLMIIDNAERLGLAQLHQLRGRVGRGSVESTCVLLYRPPLTGMARSRLDVLRKTTDGFVIAEEDLKLRGPGELLGTRQTGELEFRIADIARDHLLLPAVRRAAETIWREHRKVADALIDRWLGAGTRYRDV